ncbi:MAG TPA: hypothetical protein VD902_03820, partial [Symbiobacteriaceae bacterium]|nr:hypothetical protein [Symbiobacteriaceae bacterium]
PGPEMPGAAQPEAPSLPPGPAAPADPCAGDADAPLQIWGIRPGRSVTGPGDCRFVVSTDGFMVHATVQAPGESAAVQAVRITGARALWPAETRRHSPEADVWSVTVTLGEGSVGDTVAVAVDPGAGTPALSATLSRKAPPTIAILLQSSDGAWAPLESGMSLPPGPKRLRFRTTGGLTVDSLTPYYVTSHNAQLSPDRVTRIAADLLEVEFTAPPPLVQVYMNGTNADGLYAPPVSGHFYIGEPPVLVALNPATGAAEPIGPAPADLNGYPMLSQDGRYLAFTTLIPESTSGQLVWLADLKTGLLTRTPFQYEDGEGPGFDARGRLIAPAGPGRLGVMDPDTGKAEVISTTATFWGRVSPDGRYIAGRVGPPPGRSTGVWMGPPRAFELVVRDLLHDTEQVFPWGGYGGHTWLPDGRLLLSSVASNEAPGPDPSPEKQPQYFTIDLATGQRTPYAGTWPVPPRPGVEGTWALTDRPLVMLPDGRVLLYRWTNLPNARYGMI